MPIQWNPSILTTFGSEIIGLIIEVATFQGNQGLINLYTCICNWDKQHACDCYREVAIIQRLGTVFPYCLYLWATIGTSILSTSSQILSTCGCLI